MASSYSNAFLLQAQPQSPPPPLLRWWPRRPRGLHLRRRRTRALRLGQGQPRKGSIFRRIRLKWVKMQYSCVMKKLKQYYGKLIQDLIEASASTELLRHRVLLETSMAVPVMGVGNHYGSQLNGPKSVFMF